MTKSGPLLFFFTIAAALIGAAGTAHSGPCSAQIAQIERQIQLAEAAPQAVGPETGPSAPQTVGAQLHRQPTPGSVEHAERKADAKADAALARARKADADGKTRACSRALLEARRLYGID